MTRTRTTVGPVTTGERSLAPDLARGVMLALIALANSVMYLYGRPYGVRRHIVEHGLLDRVVSVLDVALVEGRAYPMFAALFAYGVVQVYQRQRAAGADDREARGLLRRRSRWLIVFGAVHVVLLFPGDILVTYGILGFLVVTWQRTPGRKLLTAAARGETVLAPSVAARLLTRIRPQRPPTESRLSAREHEVLTLVAEGTTNREAAALLYISEATVKTHLLHIYAKLEVTDRASAVATAYRRGVLDG